MPGSLLTLLLVLLLGLGLGAPARAALPPGNAVTDPAAILRDALPLEASELRDLQHGLEATSDDLRARRWSALRSNCDRSRQRLEGRRTALLEAVPAEHRDEAAADLTRAAEHLDSLCAAADRQDRDAILSSRRQALAAIGAVEALAVQEFPFTIPAEFNDLPRLLGRATVEIRTTKGPMTAVVDGYNAPLTAGAFIDLVQRGFYDGLPFNRAEDFYVLQTGDPEGPATGDVNPRTGQERHVPLEIRIPGRTEPEYNTTFEDLGLFKATPVLPFATLGTMGWAHSDEALDDGSSQFFFFLYEAELTPAGLNLVDGRYAAFGYVVDGFDVLRELGVNDSIVNIRVVDGADNLQAHG
ncbi:MAG: peptidylprolyl isomerase [Synechococcus sp.]